jgi:hypothetical protein
MGEWAKPLKRLGGYFHRTGYLAPSEPTDTEALESILNDWITDSVAKNPS